MIGDPMAARSWRPQEFGRRNARDIDDPLIEPVWNGLRVLAHIQDGRAVVLDQDGDEAEPSRATESLGAAVLARDAILDGYLTSQAGSGVGVFSGAPLPTTTPGDVARQMLLGAGRDRRRELADAAEAIEGDPFDPEVEVVFVAVDLLMVDGQSLLNVPLLERKRLLDSVVDEGPFVRRGIHVRPPITTWLGTWRAAGFRALAWKHANSRYRPGERNDDWAKSVLPER